MYTICNRNKPDGYHNCMDQNYFNFCIMVQLTCTFKSIKEQCEQQALLHVNGFIHTSVKVLDHKKKLSQNIKIIKIIGFTEMENQICKNAKG